MLTEEVRAYAQRSVLCWFATVDADGCPNVSPKEVFAAYDENRLLVANIASPGTVRNLLREERVCVSFVDVFVQKGFKVRGRARLVRKADPDYAELVSPLEAMTGDRFPIRGVIEVTAEAVERIEAPSYGLFPGVTEAEQVQSAMATYGVRRR